MTKRIARDIKLSFREKNIKISDKRAFLIARKSYREICWTFIEIICIYFYGKNSIYNRVVISKDALEMVKLMNRSGAVLLVMHYGNWEFLGGVLRNIGLNIHSFYLPSRFKSVDKFLFKLRSDSGIELLDRNNLIKTMRLLKKNALIGIIADQDGGKNGVFLSFFGRKVSAPPGIAVLSKKAKVPIYCSLLKRTANGKHILDLGIIANVDKVKNYSNELIMHICYKQYEKWIIKAPSLWLWAYNRFKKRRHIPQCELSHSVNLPEIFYNGFLYITLLFTWPILIVYLFKTGKIKDHFCDFFGIVSFDFVNKNKNKKIIWVHAVSVGEMAIAVSLMNRIEKDYSNIAFVVTTTCKEAEVIAHKRLTGIYKIYYLPIDFRITIKKFIRSINPSGVIISETDIWPNFLLELKEQNIPVVFYNMRVSKGIKMVYSLFCNYSRKIFEGVSLFLISDEITRERLISMRADPAKIVFTGNVKNSLVPEKNANYSLNTDPQKTIIILGSVHRSDYFFIKQLVSDVNNHFLIIIAPRKSSDFKWFEDKLDNIGIDFVNINNLTPKDKVVLICEMGILAGLYHYADLAYIGGGFEKTGVHSILEPVLCGVPVIYGPNTVNFSCFSDEFEKKGFGFKISSKNQFNTIISKVNLSLEYLKIKINKYNLQRKDSFEKSVEKVCDILELKG